GGIGPVGRSEDYVLMLLPVRTSILVEKSLSKENTISSTNHILAIAARVPGKTQPRRPISQVCLRQFTRPTADRLKDFVGPVVGKNVILVHIQVCIPS